MPGRNRRIVTLLTDEESADLSDFARVLGVSMGSVVQRAILYSIRRRVRLFQPTTPEAIRLLAKYSKSEAAPQ